MKYICNTCKHRFTGDLSVSSCPVCGSPDISEDKNKSIWWKWLLLALVAIAAIMLVVRLCNRPIIVDASLDESTGVLTVNVKSGISQSKLNRDYQLQFVCEGSSEPNYVQVEHGTKTFHIQMLPNTGYTIELVTKSGKKSKKEIKYVNDIKYFIWEQEIEDDDELPARFEIIGVDKIPNKSDNTYKVTVQISSPENFQNVKYSLAGKTQNSNVFTGIKPGDYIVEAECNGEKSSKPLRCSTFGADITKQEAQSLFNKACNDPMSVPEVNKKLAGGSVKLKRPFPKTGIEDLYSALNDAAMNGTHYTVVSFENDPNGKIKSGTLLLK